MTGSRVKISRSSRSAPDPPGIHRLQLTVRTSEEPFDVDERVSGRGRIVYLSLGSLGCMDVGLMQRLIDASGTTEDRVIVSMGPEGSDEARAGHVQGPVSPAAVDPSAVRSPDHPRREQHDIVALAAWRQVFLGRCATTRFGRRASVTQTIDAL